MGDPPARRGGGGGLQPAPASWADVGITTAVHGAGGFGKTTVAKLVAVHPRVLRRFRGQVVWVPLGRDVHTPASILEKVNGLLIRLGPGGAQQFTDLDQAREHVASVLAAGRDAYWVLDDVWYPDQEATFPVPGRCARLVTTRIPSLVRGETVPVEVDQMTKEQAQRLLTADLPEMPPHLVSGLLGRTGRWPLLRLVNEVIRDQIAPLPTCADDRTVRATRSGNACEPRISMSRRRAFKRTRRGRADRRRQRPTDPHKWTIP